jgi:hypothetical protein
VSFTTWVDGRIQAVIDSLSPNLSAELGKQEGLLAQSLINGLSTALTKNSAWLSQVAGQVATAVTTAVVGQINAAVQNIPQETTQLLGSELQQLPQQVDDILNIPAAIAAGLVNLPQQMEQAVAQAIHGLIPFGEAAPPAKGKK